MGLKDAVTPSDAGVRITVDVHAGAKQTIVPSGYDPWRKAFRAQLRSPPVRGAANRELLAEMAKLLDLSPGDFNIVHGVTGNLKVIEVAGADVDTVVGRFLAVIERGGVKKQSS